jgi:DNA polymerase-3 subunit alpha/error-prone DNA polymerase
MLNAISNYSLLRGVHSPRTICAAAHTFGYTSVALIDRNNLYGFPALIDACDEFGLVPVAAAEIDAFDGSAVIYAENETGFGNLCRIISEKQCRTHFSLCGSLRDATDGLHIVSDTVNLLFALHDKVNVYYRIQSCKRPPKAVMDAGIPAVILPPMAFCTRDDYHTHRLLRAIDCTTTLTQLESDEQFKVDALFRPLDTLMEQFGVFEKAVETTQLLFEHLSKVNLYKNRQWIMPYSDDPLVASQTLRDLAYRGAEKRYGELSEPVQERLDYELSIIESKGFSGYFLVVNDIVMQSPRTCGRGSGAASIIAYSLGITNVDPLRYNLMFERFLNPGRTDPPDIDVDFAWDERDTVLDYVFKKYTTTHAAMVATHLTCGARMAIREVARLYGLTESEISIVCKKIPYFVDTPEKDENIEEILHQWPTLANMPFDPPWPDILKDAVKIMGLPRGIGTHCGGVIITPMPIHSVAPVQYSAKGYPIIQWEKDGAERMGLVKIDLLGNRSLAVIRDAIANVKREHADFDERRWDPQSDMATQQLLAEGRSMGVFYVESPAMRLLQRKTRKGDFEHLTIHSSIIRPAANKYIREYVRRLHGEPYTPLHPSLGTTLSETFGIMVYQEDVSKVAIALAGFSVEDADMLRKIMSKKAKGRTFDEFRKKFYDGATKLKVDIKVINAVWEMMLSFSGYSFCKPHSASYVQVSFQSAYLKAHYPAAFMAAVLSNYGGYYGTQAYISEAQRLGVTVVPPDVNRSGTNYIAEGNEIITGLCQIKGLSNDAKRQLVADRNENGLYDSIEDMLRRCAIAEGDTEKLVIAGAYDRLLPKMSRPQQFWIVRRFYRTGRNDSVPALKPLTIDQYLQYQYQILGFLTSCHPITLVKSTYNGPRIKATAIDKSVGKNIVIAGWCITAKTVSTKHGDAMEFVTFEDETGTFETVFFPDIYKTAAPYLTRYTAFLLYGTVTQEFGVAVLEVKRIGKMQ